MMRMAVNQDELAVCRKRGHGVQLLGPGWQQCKWCGMWVREMRTIEQREDDPPEHERDPMGRLKKRMNELESGNTE